MEKKGFSDLTVDEKFKAVRDDIRLLADHFTQHQRETSVIAQSVAELRLELRKLTGCAPGYLIKPSQTRIA